ncbi:MAG: serine/threonine-protein kinase [Vicinamibacteria bacterium]
MSPGTRVGRYEVRSLLGAGAMADVYLAFDPKGGREVAIKVLAPGPGASERLQRFEREARSAAAMSHPNIVSVFEVGWQDRMPFIAMEYVSGRTLRELLEEGPFSVEAVVDIGAQLADGLGCAHDAGIVHRDLKPENVMVTPEGIAKILDFGLSKPIASPKLPADAAATDEVLTLPGTILGTLQYMSPEQASGYRVDYRSDQFSLGALLYEMATGIVPFARDTVPRTLAAVIEGKPEGLEVFRTEVPPELRAILEKTLRKRPEKRYPSMEELAGALRGLRRASSSPSRGGIAG